MQQVHQNQSETCYPLPLTLHQCYYQHPGHSYDGAIIASSCQQSSSASFSAAELADELVGGLTSGAQWA